MILVIESHAKCQTGNICVMCCELNLAADEPLNKLCYAHNAARLLDRFEHCRVLYDRALHRVVHRFANRPTKVTVAAVATHQVCVFLKCWIAANGTPIAWLKINHARLCSASTFFRVHAKQRCKCRTSRDLNLVRLVWWYREEFVLSFIAKCLVIRRSAQLCRFFVSTIFDPLLLCVCVSFSSCEPSEKWNYHSQALAEFEVCIGKFFVGKPYDECDHSSCHIFIFAMHCASTQRVLSSHCPSYGESIGPSKMQLTWTHPHNANAPNGTETHQSNGTSVWVCALHWLHVHNLSLRQLAGFRVNTITVSQISKTQNKRHYDSPPKR